MNSSSPVAASYQSNNTKDKDQTDLDDMLFNIASFLQTLMRKSGYDFDKTQVFSSTFLTFMHNSLFYLAQYLISIRKNLGQNVNELEQACINEIYRHSPLPEVGAKIDKATKLMKQELPQEIKQYMLDAKFQQSETKENHDAYISMVSNVLISETGKFSMLKERFKYSVGTEDFPKNQDDSSSNQSGCDILKEKQKYHISLPQAEEILYLTPMRLLATSRKYDIYHVISESAVLKVLNPRTSTVEDIKILDDELKFGKKFYHPSVRRSLERVIFRNRQALLLRWTPGIPISQIEGLDVKKFLILAREITSSLLAIHASSMMYVNLTSEHIIYNRQDNSIKFISCGSSTAFGYNKNISTQDMYQRDLRFISPEQTGRVNRQNDFRSDFYSLGVIFYRMITGKYPFNSDNPLELIHLQICQDPLPVHAIDSKIPITLSTMISKLMKKDADERYQSTKGLLHDIDLMLGSENENNETLESIELGHHDVPEVLLMPQKLYGQATNLQTLLSAFNKARSSFEIVFVTGNSGSGKSTLIQEMYKPVTQNDGIFVCGKHDFSSTKPYSALIEAVNNLCDDLLLRDESTKTCFKNKILEATADEGRLLTEAVSNLNLLIGDQPSISDAHGEEAKNRFHYVFIKFIKALCSVGQPILLVLEDLQWMDIESFRLLSLLMTDKSLIGLMLVGVYRDNEVSYDHLVTHLYHHLEVAKKTWTTINVNNMDHDNVNEFLSDALFLPPFETYKLSAILHKKTYGNPFYVKQIFKFLHEQGMIFFCSTERKWKFNIIDTKDISEDVKQLLRLKILSLDEHTQTVLKVASCIGCSFSMRAVKLIVDRDDGISGAISSGMLIQYTGSDSIYHFAHDNIQEAAFSLLPDDRKFMFLHMGRKLWKSFSRQELQSNIYIVVKLLGNDVEMLKDQEDRLEIVGLFLQAGNKAIKSTAFKQALEYLETGIKLLDKDWKSYYELSLNLHNNYCQVAYCISDIDIMDTTMDEIIKHADSPLDLVQSYSWKIKYFNDKHLFDDAISTAGNILNILNERIVNGRCASMTTSNVLQLKTRLAEMSQEAILEMREMNNHRLSAIMMILHDMLISCRSNLQLLASVSARLVEFTLIHGISKFSPFAFGAFGLTLCLQGDSMIANKLGKISIKLLEKTRSKEIIPNVYGCYFGLIAHYHVSIHLTVDPLLKAFGIGLEVGSHSSCILNATIYCIVSFLSGKNILHLKNAMDKFFEALPAVKIKVILSVYQAMENLQNEHHKNPGMLTGDFFDYASCFEKNEQVYDIARVYVIRCILAYIFNDYIMALECIELFRPLQNYINGAYFHQNFLFYESLVLLALPKTGHAQENKMHIVQNNSSQLKKASENAPENYLNKWYLIEAEMASILNSEERDISNYEKAIALSRKHGFPHEEGIACERTALFLFRSGSSLQANNYLKRALDCYRSWGALSKINQLVQKYPAIANHAQYSSSGILDTELQVETRSESSVSLLSCDITSYGGKRARFY